jgi:hypothetical protein
MKVLVSRLARPRFGAVVAVAALTGAAVIAAVAMAHNVAHSNSVTITRAGPIATPPGRAFYKGQVVSPKHACEVAREVQVFHVVATGDVRIGRARSTNAGLWKDDGPRVPKGDKIYALIETKVLNAPPGHNHTCKVARSAPVAFPYP